MIQEPLHSLSKTRLISVTPDAEKTMLYIARVSNPAGQDSGKEGLLRYCIQHGHWSVFEHAHMTVEITCPVWLATQILRHRSFCFQQFSQRYGEAEGGAFYQEARSQDFKNRQSSIDNVSEEIKEEWLAKQVAALDAAFDAYNWAISQGIAKECARAVLPQSTLTRIYMTGNCRSFLHYLQLRLDASTQKEHRQVAELIRAHFVEAFPVTASAVQWEVGLEQQCLEAAE
jgi:thymidylate synthase (FAD)